MLTLLDITLIDKCCNGLSDLVGNPESRMSQDAAHIVAKMRALITCSVTAQMISAFVFAYAKSMFSHDATLIIALTR